MAQNSFQNTTGYAAQPSDPAMAQFQMNRLQYVQYECIKTELKEEYEKRVNFLHRRIEKRQAQQGPYQDAHLILM
jgi:Holliday junction resolvasome RuvABC endonuclease subunit